MTARFLIATAYEPCWRTDLPVLFLGEWCKRYERRAVWETLDAVVAPYHWNDREQFSHDYEFLASVYEDFLPQLSATLNRIHNVNHPSSYWRIVVGPWLQYFSQILFDRWSMLAVATRRYQLCGFRPLVFSAPSFIPSSMSDFVDLMQRDDWNQKIYSDVVRRLTGIPVDPMQAFADRVAERSRVRGTLRPLMRRTAEFLSVPFVRETDTFVKDEPLPRLQTLALHLRLRQVPVLWSTCETPAKGPDPRMRDWSLIGSKSSHPFLKILGEVIPEHIPTSYLEAYKDIVRLSEHLPWPKNPRTVMGSTSFHSDDVFKVWAAERKLSGTSLILTQHGGSYGVAKQISIEDHETRIADRFLTWGWSEQRPNHHPSVAGRLVHDARESRRSPSNKILLVSAAYPRQSYKLTSEPIASQWLDYFEQQCDFARALPQELRSNLVVRLYPVDFGWCQAQRWRVAAPDVALEGTNEPFRRSIRNARIVVVTYNATAILETMISNIPTLICWLPNHWELRDSAKPYFDQLERAGIFHTSSRSAAQKISDVWPDVWNWWQEPSVQRSRNEFVERYARVTKDPVGTLIGLLPNTAKTPKEEHIR